MVYAMSQPLRDVPDRFLRRRDRGDVLTAGKAAGVDCAGDLIDVIADGGELAAYLGILIRRTGIQGKAHDEATDK